MLHVDINFVDSAPKGGPVTARNRHSQPSLITIIHLITLFQIKFVLSRNRHHHFDKRARLRALKLPIPNPPSG